MKISELRKMSLFANATFINAETHAPIYDEDTDIVDINETSELEESRVKSVVYGYCVGIKYHWIFYCKVGE